MRVWKRLFVVLMLAAQYGFSQEIVIDSTLFDDCVEFQMVADSTVPEKLIRSRLSALQSIIPLRYHAITHQYIDIFTFKKHEFVRRMLEHSPQFFALYEKKLAEYGLPDELKYLSLIESGLNPRIISYAGAGGLWQFMPATGREFGMYQDAHVDERFDPEKATEGACRYLKQLYRSFGDWELALAAYNTGPGNVRRAMQRSGSNSFWGIYAHLPHQTRMYVPQFVAIIYMMNHHADHNIHAQNPIYPMLSDTIRITGAFDLVKFSELADISLDEFYRLNPHILKTELASARPTVVRIPNYKYDYVNQNRIALWESASLKAKVEASVELIATAEPTHQKEEIAAKLAPTVQQKENKAGTRYHRVQAGDTLWGISERYGISFEKLKKINRLRSNNVMKGQKLRVG